MAVFDITVPVRPGMPVYEGDPEVRTELAQSIAAGGICNVTRLEAGVHTGTHIDAPNHFIAGAAGVDETPLDVLIGPAFVADATAARTHLDATAIAALDIPAGSERLLFKTRNSRLWGQDSFARDYIAITPDGARALVARGVRLVAIDYLSVAPFTDPAPTHLVLLEAGVVILEGVDLRGVAPGPYTIVCLPLLLAGADGAPARTLLIGGEPQTAV